MTALLKGKGSVVVSSFFFFWRPKLPVMLDPYVLDTLGDQNRLARPQCPPQTSEQGLAAVA